MSELIKSSNRSLQFELNVILHMVNFLININSTKFVKSEKTRLQSLGHVYRGFWEGFLPKK